MITFKQYLSEARLAPLYHGTSIDNAKAILKSNVMRTNRPEIGFGVQSKTSAISFTRAIKYAMTWALESLHENEAVILEFDQQKLAQRYKIVPFNFWSTEEGRGMSMSDAHLKTRKRGYTESEERVTKDITNVNQYIKTIWVGDKDLIKEFDGDPRVKYIKFVYGKE